MAAHSGSSHFKWQRLTAILLLPLTLYLVLLLVSLVGADFETARTRLAIPVIWLPMFALVLAGVWHMWLGMQVIIDDYAKDGLRKALQVLSSVFSCAVVLVALYAIYQLSIGA